MGGKAFNIAKNLKYVGCQCGLANYSKPTTSWSKSGKGKIYLSFKDNILWGADLVDMQWISKFNKRFCFLFCVIAIDGKHAWVFPLIDKKGITIINAFQKN